MNEVTQDTLKTVINLIKELYRKSPTVFAFLLGVGTGLFIAFIF
jgi:hypothetical protein